MRPFLTIIGLVLLAMLAACSRLPTPDAPDFRAGAASTVPMQLIHTGDMGGLPMIPVTVGGQQSWWLIDTGSSHNLVSLRLAQLLKLRSAASSHLATIGGRQSAAYYRLPDLQIGALQLEKQSAAALDLSVLSGSDGLMVDGILGMPALERLAVTLDFRARQVSFAPQTYGLNPHSIIPFRIESGVPVASLNVLGGRPGNFILDTGNAGALVVLPAYAGPQQGLQAGGSFVEVEDLGGSIPTQLALLPQLRLGNVWLQQIPVSLPVRNRGVATFAGSAGNALFGNQVVTFDFPNRQLLLGGAAGQLPLPGSFGFLLAAGNTIEVVLNNSPAAMAGLRAGDRIVAVNGRDTQSASSHAIWRLLYPAAGVQLTVVRGQQPFTVNVQRAYFLRRLGG